MRYVLAFLLLAAGDFRIRAIAAIAPMGFGVSVAKPTIAA
jgi:hypothetical protein